MTNQATKTCTKCAETKPTTEFYPVKTGSDKLRSACKKCTGVDSARFTKSRRAEGRWFHSIKNGRHRASKAGLPVELFDEEEMLTYWKEHNIDPDHSYYTGHPLGDVHNLDHKIPLDEKDSPGHVLSNVVPTLPGENRVKSNKSALSTLYDMHLTHDTPVIPMEDHFVLHSVEWSESDHKE